MAESILISIDTEKFNDDKLHRLKSILKASPGKSRIYFKLLMDGNGGRELVSNSIKINLSYRTLSELVKIVGPDNIKVKVRE